MTTLKIHEAAIRQNVREIHTRTDGRIIAVVKEDGYGIGLRNAYDILHRCGIDFYGVATAEEAFELRSMGCKDDILLLMPELSVNQCSRLLIQNIIFMLGSYEQAGILKEASARTKIVPRVHLAIDTGLGRYGFAWDDLKEVKLCTSGIKIEGCYTHFATAARNYERNIRVQFRHFEESLHTLTKMGISYGMTHVSASKAFYKCGDLGCDGVRIGSLLLGCGQENSFFQRAVWLESPIFMKNVHKRGKRIGYDGKLKLKRDTQIGIVKTGYSDGVFLGGQDGEESVVLEVLKKLYKIIIRRYRGKYVKINGIQVPVLGKIGLNHLLVDLTDGNYLIGDEVRIAVNPIFVPKKVERVLEPSEDLVRSKAEWMIISSRAGLVSFSPVGKAQANG